MQACLETGGGGSLQGGRYLVYKLPDTGPIVGKECVICLEDLLPGMIIARLVRRTSAPTLALLPLTRCALSPASATSTARASTRGSAAARPARRTLARGDPRRNAHVAPLINLSALCRVEVSGEQ